MVMMKKKKMMVAVVMVVMTVIVMVWPQTIKVLYNLWLPEFTGVFGLLEAEQEGL